MNPRESSRSHEAGFAKLLAGATHERRRRPRSERLMSEALASIYGEEDDDAELNGEVAGQPATATALSTLLPNILRACETPEQETLRDLIAQWATLVGPEVAARTCPRRLYQQTLVVEVADSVTRFKLQGSLSQITAKIRAFTRNNVSTVRLEAGGQSAATRSLRRPLPPPPAPPSILS